MSQDLSLFCTLTTVGLAHDSSKSLLFGFILQLFREAINMAHSYKANPTDFMDEVLQELEVCSHFSSFLLMELVDISMYTGPMRDSPLTPVSKDPQQILY